MGDLFDFFRSKPIKLPHEYYDFNMDITRGPNDSLSIEGYTKPNSEYHKLFPKTMINGNVIEINLKYINNILGLEFYANKLLTTCYDSHFQGQWYSREEELKFTKGLPHFFFCNIIRSLLQGNYIKNNDTIFVDANAFGLLVRKHGAEKSQEAVVKMYESMGFKKSEGYKKLHLISSVWNIIEKCIYKNKIQENLKINVSETIREDQMQSLDEPERALIIYKQCNKAFKWVPGDNTWDIISLYLVAMDAKKSALFKMTKKQLARLKTSLEKVDNILVFIGDFLMEGYDILCVINKSSEEDLKSNFDSLLSEEILQENEKRKLMMREIIGYNEDHASDVFIDKYAIKYFTIFPDSSNILLLEKYIYQYIGPNITNHFITLSKYNRFLKYINVKCLMDIEFI